MAAATLRAPPACVGMAAFALPAASGCAASTRALPSLAARCGGGVVRSSSRVSRPAARAPPASFGFLASSITETKLRGAQLDVLNRSKGAGAAGAVCSLPCSPETLRWVLVAAAAVLMFVKNGGIQRQYLVPLVAIEPPRQALNWLKGDYGLWAAFIALAVKLFYYIPGELELPLFLLLLIITAPAQLTQYRGTTSAWVVTLALAAFLAYQHYQSSQNVKAMFQGDRIFPSIAIILSIIVPVLFLANGVM